MRFRCNPDLVMKGTGGADCSYDSFSYNCTLRPCPYGYEYPDQTDERFYQCKFEEGVFKKSETGSTEIPKCRRKFV